jgi:aryl-alcohol dehydrogenase-like predicted oxidoreductase
VILVQNKQDKEPDLSSAEVSRRQFLQAAGTMGSGAALDIAASFATSATATGAVAQQAQNAAGAAPPSAFYPRTHPDLAGYSVTLQNPVTTAGPPLAPLPMTNTGSDQIPRKPLGKTGLEVSVLGCGGHHLGDAPDVGVAINIVHGAIDAGVNFFDNCWEYYNGKTEDWLGRALQGGRRDKVILMTKVCTHGRTARLAMQMLEESLRRLQTDHLDVWQIHAITYDNDPQLAYAKGGVIEALDQAKKQGKVRFVGFTGHKDPGFHLQMIQMGYPFDTVQMPLNPFDASFFSFQRQVLPEANRRGIAALGMKSMGGNGNAIKKGVATAQELLRYAMSLPVATTICGMDSMKVLQQNLAVARNFKPMTSGEMQALQGRCLAVAVDGRFEPYKVSLVYDNPVTRQPHGFPIDQDQKEVKEMFKQTIGVPGSDEERGQ